MGTHTSSNPVVLDRWSSGYTAMLFTLLAGGVIAALLAGPFYSHAHRWRHNVATLFVATVLSVGGVELVVRWMDLFGISYYADSSRYQRSKIADDELYYVHAPGSTANYRGFDVRINSLGMRGPEIGDAEFGETRVLFLGDSVTFGWGVRQEDSFAETVQPRLSERLGGPVIALNSGVGSYNTENEWAFLNRYGAELAPDAVALVYVINDIYSTPEEPFDPLAGERVAEMAPPEVLTWLLGKSWTYRLVVHFGRHSQADVAARTQLADTPGWRESVDALRRINDWCRGRDIPFVVYLYRTTPNPLSEMLWPALRDTGNEIGFPVIDVLPWFEGQDLRAVTNSIVDSHPNAAGHAILADGIAETISAALRAP